jgi:hypothetical protein
MEVRDFADFSRTATVRGTHVNEVREGHGPGRNQARDAATTTDAKVTQPGAFVPQPHEKLAGVSVAGETRATR